MCRNCAKMRKGRGAAQCRVIQLRATRPRAAAAFAIVMTAFIPPTKVNLVIILICVPPGDRPRSASLSANLSGLAHTIRVVCDPQNSKDIATAVYQMYH